MNILKEPAQLVETAIRIERAGRDFYIDLSNHTPSHAASDVFSYLASEEEKHIGIFRQVLDKVANYTPRFSYPGEYGVFLDEVAELAIGFFQNARHTGKVDNFNQAVDLAMQVELESIVFYQEACQYFTDDQSIILQKIIDEEKTHILELKSLSKKVHID
jgi:rubrerythrin